MDIPTGLLRLNAFRECCLFDESARPSRSTIEKWERNGVIPVVRIGGIPFVDMRKISAFLDRQHERATRRRYKPGAGRPTIQKLNSK